MHHFEKEINDDFTVCLKENYLDIFVVAVVVVVVVVVVVCLFVLCSEPGIAQM